MPATQTLRQAYITDLVRLGLRGPDQRTQAEVSAHLAAANRRANASDAAAHVEFDAHDKAVGWA